MKKLLSVIACLLSAHNVSAFAAVSLPTNSKLFALKTTAFRNLGPIPKRYSCDAEDVSPALTWQNVPAKAASLALILEDPDAPRGTFYHWLVYNIPPKVNTFSEGMKTYPEGTLVGENSFGKQQYNGPCPPKGAEHRYIFTLYALDIQLPLKANASATDLLTAIENHILGKTSITGLFKH